MLSSAFSGMKGASEDIQIALQSIRKHLGMEVAYISEFVGSESVFQTVDAPGLEHMIKAGDRISLDAVYCRHILAGTLPELMADTADHALTQSIPITKAVPIGAHMSVPIRRKDGSAIGMFCCLSPTPNRTLNDRDLQVMRVFADLAAADFVRREEKDRATASKQHDLQEVMAQRSFTMVFQPIWSFVGQRPAGLEALCRFTKEPYRSPDRWFDDASAVGLGVDLELAVIETALEAFAWLPDPVYLSVNVSPATILSGRLGPTLARIPPGRLVVEITEHAEVRDYPGLVEALKPLRTAGIRLAIDDAGAGYSSLQHIVQLQPDIIKLDMSLTRSVDQDPARRALAAALIYFAAETGCAIVAEGIETESEMETLRLLGVSSGQGYFISRPLDETGIRGLLGMHAEQRTA